MYVCMYVYGNFELLEEYLPIMYTKHTISIGKRNSFLGILAHKSLCIDKFSVARESDNYCRGLSSLGINFLKKTMSSSFAMCQSYIN